MLHRNLKIEQHEPHKRTGVNSGPKVSSVWSTGDHRRATIAKNPVISHECGKEGTVIITNVT